MKNILVTGGAGFIGSHTCLTLLEKGFEIFVVDSFINSNKKSLEKLKIILSKSEKIHSNKINIFNGDIRDEFFLNSIFNIAKKNCKEINGVIHFAGLKSVEESLKEPLRYWDNNVNGTLKLINVMKKHDCRTFVFSSSATIYASSNKKIKEDFQKKSINPYASTKIVVEQLLNELSTSDSKWRLCNLRYFNPIGAHASGLIGESPQGKPKNIFPLINLVASKHLSNIHIYGNDWPTKDGTGVRDYIHVMDIAEGHVLALNFLFDNKPQISNINLGTGTGYSVLDLIKTFENVNDIRVPYVFAPKRKGDNPYVVADNSLALSLLNWFPKRTLEEMCRDGWNWHIKNLDGKTSI